MDIMQAHQPESGAKPAGSGTDLNHSSEVGNQRLQLALSIEEKQYALVMTLVCHPLTIFCRINVRDRVKRLHKEPREDCRLEVERLRQILTTELIHLQSLQSALHQTASTTVSNAVEDPHEESFNDDDGEVDPSGEDQLSDERDSELDLPPERMPLNLPSSYNTNATAHPFRQAELGLRVQQATRYLAALRDAIAQKSFQYSHVMHSAPTKAARTRSRTAIIRITDQVSHYSKVYCRARAALVRLGANEITLTKFKLLTKDDVKASTAILDPNIPQSSTIRLSWIWETGPRISGSAPDAIQECKQPA